MFTLNIDLSSLEKLRDQHKKIFEDSTKLAATEFATAVHAKGKELASQRLKTRRSLFLENWTMSEKDGVFLITMDAKVKWIDEGQRKHNMLDDLLKSPKAKTAKDGSRYLIVPFNHSPGQGPTGSTPAQHDLIKTVQKELKKRKIPFAPIEKHPDGTPKLGLLHRLNIMNAPLKKVEGPGMGKGPIGSVRSGPTGIPFLKGINIYQSTHVSGGVTTTKKSILTFRLASSKQAGQGRWDHPGTPPTHIFDDVWAFAQATWRTSVEPAVTALILSRLP